MANTKDSEFVTFENSLGETVSNDPNYLAKERLEAAGIQVGGASTPSDHDEAITTPYDELKQQELKDLAKERGVDLKGAKTVGDLRQRLVDADDAAEDEDEDDSDSDTGESQE